ncbi:MAG: U32 family peptidase [Tenericutes bacterium]|nr:U32 family peptidase [Mycoplasmatota bacterium]
MKLLIMPKSIDQIESLIEDIDGVIVGIKDLSINQPAYFTLDEIKKINEIIKNNGKEIFVSLNKNMFNKDLEILEYTLLQLDNLKLNGILYYDIAIVNFKKNLKLVTPLVWNQEHLTTNYLTSNFWYEYGAKYTMLSSEITLDEINEIALNANAKTMVPIFGYLPMFVSRRHLVKNYLDTFKIKDDSNINYIEKENKIYAIIDSNDGTIAYSNKCLNGINETLKLNVDYIVLNSFNINNATFKRVVSMYNIVNESNIQEFKEEIDKMLETDTGFLYKETIYEVKK